MSLKDNSRKIAKEIVDLQETVTEEGRDWTSEEQEKFDRLAARHDELKQAIEAEEQREEKLKLYRQELERTQEDLDAGREFGGKHEDAEDLEERHKQAFEAMLNASPQEVPKYKDEIRALGTQIVGTSGYGGVLVPTEFQTDLISGIRSFGGIQASRAQRYVTARGGTLRWPLINDTNEATILSEASAKSTSKRVDFKVLEIDDLKLATGAIKISRELRQDGVMPVVDIVKQVCITRFGRAFENGMANSTATVTTSTGFGGLYSCSTNAHRGSTSDLRFAKGITNMTAEDLIEVQHAVDPIYRANGEYMFRDNILAGIRKLRWGSSEPFIWSPSFQAGVPDRILGKPYIVNNSMSTAKFGAASSDLYPVWFGDFNAGFMYRIVLPPTITVLNERYADEDVVGVIGFMRCGSRPVSSDIGDFPLAAIRTT